MIRTVRTNSDHHDFIKLINYLDAELAFRDGEDHGFYAQFNKVDLIKHVVVSYDDEHAVGCGSIKVYQPGVMEIKRMYTKPKSRGKGIATTILNELEK
jgi:predicted GNAT family acetyltransferase